MYMSDFAPMGATVRAVEGRVIAVYKIRTLHMMSSSSLDSSSNKRVTGHGRLGVEGKKTESRSQTASSP